MAAGQTLTVRDTAANIIASAASQLSGSIVPTAWQISGNAVVSTAGAILLAGLPSFGAGSYKLTISDSPTISIANANTLGGIQSSLLLGGNHLGVAGTVAQLSTLTSGAKAIVTPQISDTFANVAANLTLGSGLLGGTLVVSDSESVTVSQASAFLALVGGSGIPAANVSFGGNFESVTDSFSNIQTLTGSSGWTGNASLQAKFHLIVADTTAVLTNAANTTALAGMAGTTLSIDDTASAAAAETLFSLTNTIHFTKGSHHLTVQDTATNLLNPANSDGLGIADTVQLSANATVGAADAETLLGQAHFNLNHVLTISDTSANLLDGVLAGMIAGQGSNVIVHLTAPETLDAATATRLVGLHGFDNANMSIADSASYLLNPANAQAEHLATSVTLTGDETVSVATATSLDAVEHFTLGAHVLHLASGDYADQAGLQAIGDFGAGFHNDGFTVFVTQDSLALTPNQYANVHGDSYINLNGHVISAALDGVTVSSGGGNVTVAGTGVSGATLHVYAGSGGTDLSHPTLGAAAVSATVAESAIGNAVVVTESVNGVESAPIIAIELNAVTTAAGGATFASAGAVQVGVGQFVDLYTKVAAPTAPPNPILVYDPNAHTLSLNVAGHAPVTLVTLGSTTTPTSLTAAEIFIQHFT